MCRSVDGNIRGSLVCCVAAHGSKFLSRSIGSFKVDVLALQV
jgi:hypothetical protein